jgi:hypothetical protein
LKRHASHHFKQETPLLYQKRRLDERETGLEPATLSLGS